MATSPRDTRRFLSLSTEPFPCASTAIARKRLREEGRGVAIDPRHWEPPLGNIFEQGGPEMHNQGRVPGFDREGGGGVVDCQSRQNRTV